MKFAKANKNGQIPKNCLYFNFCGKHCRILKSNLEVVEKDCKVLNGGFCKTYKTGKETK